MSKTLLSPEVCKAIDHWVAKYPNHQKRSALSPALLIVQEAHEGYLTEELVEAVADYLEQPSIAAFEVATFYSMFEMSPVGKHKLGICTSISCVLAGSDKILEHLKKRLGIGLGETTTDGRFTLKEVECLGACRHGPVIHCHRQYHECLTPEKVDALLEKWEA